MPKLPAGRRTRAALALGALAAATAVIVTASRPVTHGSLVLRDSVLAYCWQPPTPADWQSQTEHGIEFGVDALALSSTSAHLTVTAVTMINPTAGVQLEKVAFVPSGAVGTGTPGDHPWPVSDPRLTAHIETLPAHLRAMPEVAAFMGIADATEWGLAVVVRTPPDTPRARIDGFVITYRSGSVTRRLRTRVSITLGTAPNLCPH